MNATATSRRFELVRSLRLGISLLTAATLVTGTLGACVVTDPDDEFEFQDSNASADQDDFRSLEQTAKLISEDPSFTYLLDNLAAMTAQYALAQRDLSDEDLDAQIITMSYPGYSEYVDLDTFLEASMVEASLVEEQMAVVAQLISKYELQDLSATQLEQVFGAAMQTEESITYIKGAVEYEVRTVVGEIDTEIDDCEAECILEYAAAAALGLAAYVSALAAATLLGPGWPIAVGIASAAYASALAKAENSKDNCFAECAGEIPSDEECLKDSDCAGDEFCWKGVIGIGANECRPEKSQGQTCSRHGQCTSGCCKLHVWTNPLSKTCRPASKCN